MSLQSVAKKIRKPKADVSPLFYTRWSPRAMTGKSMSLKELTPLFEAARWAPSSFNNQPWRFIVAVSKKDRERFMPFMLPANQAWTQNASALVVILSSTVYDYNGKPATTHSFDTGSAWMSLCLEGARRGLVVHGMAGIVENKIRKTLKIPKKYKIEAMCAIGKLAKPSALPEKMRKMEKPSLRKPMKDIANFKGKFSWK